MDVSKEDWKLYRKKLPKWQEAYMEKLIASYVQYLQSSESASTKFWELEKKIKNDKKSPGVIIEIKKQDLPFDLIRLIREEVITMSDLNEFSDELVETIKFLMDRFC